MKTLYECMYGFASAKIKGNEWKYMNKDQTSSRKCIYFIYMLIFLLGFIAHFNEFHEREFECSNGSAAKFLNGRFDRIVGVIGGQSSSVSIQVLLSILV